MDLHGAKIWQSVTQGGRSVHGLCRWHPMAWDLSQLLSCPEGRTLNATTPSTGGPWSLSNTRKFPGLGAKRPGFQAQSLTILAVWPRQVFSPLWTRTPIFTMDELLE